MSRGANDRSGSAQWEWRRVMVSRGGAASKAAPRRGTHWRRFTRRDPGEWITVRLKWSGGAEGWVVVAARGEINAIPGHRALADLVLDINQAR